MPQGYFPPEKEFCVETMSLKKYKKFKLWHTEQVNKYKNQQLTYNYEQEMIKYCLDDTRVLRAGVLQYLKMFKQIRYAIRHFFFSRETEPFFVVFISVH